MQNLQTNIAEILILLFLIITFLQSGLDKIADWRGNVDWLKDHFSKTFMGGMVPLMVFSVLILEVVAGVLCIVGIYDLLKANDPVYGLWGAVVSCVTLLALLFGQRVAKDYEGARTIAVYFIVAIFGVYLLNS